MTRLRGAGRVSWVLGAVLALGLGCASSTSNPRQDFTRRGVERTIIASPEFGGARGRAFEDVIPIGARITGVHVAHGRQVNGIWLTYERNGVVRDTPRRGGHGGTTEVFKLKRGEKIVAMHAHGTSTIDGLVIVTNKRTRSFGSAMATAPDTDDLRYTQLTEQERKRYVGIGITGRADKKLHRLSLRIQVRDLG